MVSIVSHSVAQTEQIGAAIGRLLRAGDVIALSGDLGAGKTALTRGIGAGFGALEPITSPTFVLIHEHRRQADTQHLHHLDCYRLGSIEDGAMLGLEDIFNGDNVAVVEWAERVITLLPEDHLWVELTHETESTRRLEFTPHGVRAEALLVALWAALKIEESST